MGIGYTREKLFTRVNKTFIFSEETSSQQVVKCAPACHVTNLHSTMRRRDSLRAAFKSLRSVLADRLESCRCQLAWRELQERSSQV